MTDESTPPPAPAPESTPPGLTSEEKTLGIVVHLLPLISAFIGPLIVYLLKKDSSAYVRAQAASVLNFQLFIAAAWIVSLILLVVFIGALLLPLVGLFNLVFIIIATIKASEGVVYKFPVTIPLVK